MSDQNYKIKEKENYCLTNYRTPTRRGVMWLGQTCNMSCYFCYFAARIADKTHPEHAFMSLEKAKEICRIFREEYDFNSIDIQGGEPTIYKGIFELIDYCNEIGLKPTLITNLIALNNYKFCKKFKDHNVYDFLISLQAIGDVYDKIVDLKDGFKRQMEALDNIQKLGIPIRVNTVLSNEAVPQLKEICDIAVKYKARVVNFLGYNPTGDQDKTREESKVPHYKQIVQILEPLIDYLEDNDIEVNIRFFPYCVFSPKYRKNAQNQKQKVFDLHEWEVSSRIWIDADNQRREKEKLDKRPNLQSAMDRYRLRNFRVDSIVKNIVTKKNDKEFSEPLPYQGKLDQMMKDYKPNFNDTLGHVEDLSKVDHYYMEMLNHVNYLSYSNKCKGCDVRPICDGIYSDFLKYFGDGGIEPIKNFGQKIYDPRVYIKDQMKVVEKEESSWALPSSSCQCGAAQPS